MKAAAKAKSRASQEERAKEDEPSTPKPPPAKKEKLEQVNLASRSELHGTLLFNKSLVSFSVRHFCLFL